MSSWALVNSVKETCGVQLVTFEAFRDLIKLLQLSISEETGIALADDENLEQRASAKSTAVGQYSQQIAQAAGRPAPGAAAGEQDPSMPLLINGMHRGMRKSLSCPRQSSPHVFRVF